MLVLGMQYSCSSVDEETILVTWLIAFIPLFDFFVRDLVFTTKIKTKKPGLQS